MSSPSPEESVPNLLPARMLNEFVYCPRLFHLEWAQAEWAESHDTVAGSHAHRRVDREVGDLPPPDQVAGGAGFSARAVLLSSEQERLIARFDLVEGSGKDAVPVDYKRGQVPDDPPWDTDRIQLGAQALLLRSSGYRCDRAIVWYVASRRRVEIVVNDLLLDEVRAVRDAALAAAASSKPPPPLVDSPKCPRCSLVGICLPDEQNHLTTTDGVPPEEVRRLYAARNDALPLYVQAHGAIVSKRGQELVLKRRDHDNVHTRLIDISMVSVFGNVSVTPAALAALADRSIPVCHFSFGGWFRAVTHALGHRNCMLRLHQYRTSQHPETSLALAQGFIRRKILNCRTLLRRNAVDPSAEDIHRLKQLSDQAARAGDTATLLGVEGMAARIYFSSFPKMLKAQDQESAEAFDFTHRNRRPPNDPVNALLSLAYSVLSRDWTVALLAVGLDPYLGFFHRPRFGRAALALDLMEEFRPLIADSVVIQVVNNGEVRPRDFVRRGAGVNLTQRGRRRFFRAYERRMAHLVRHPIFQYRASYRQILELQARLLGRHLSGELSSYDGFRTR